MLVILTVISVDFKLKKYEGFKEKRLKKNILEVLFFKINNFSDSCSIDRQTYSNEFNLCERIYYRGRSKISWYYCCFSINTFFVALKTDLQKN